MTSPFRTTAPLRPQSTPAAVPLAGAPRQDARPLPDAVRARMETAFGADFSAVRIRRDDAAAANGLAAFTRGESVAVHPGLEHPHSPEGLEVIGHELAHVLQQRAGRVPGTGLTEDPALEAEADAAGRRAARGEPAGLAVADGGAGATSAAETASTAPTQPDGLAGGLKKLFGRSTAPAQQAAAPVPAPSQPQQAPVPPGTLDVAAIEEQLQDMFARARGLQEAFNAPGVEDARPIAAQLDKVLRIIGALSDARQQARRPAPPPPPSSGEGRTPPSSGEGRPGPGAISAAPPETSNYAMTPPWAAQADIYMRSPVLPEEEPAPPRPPQGRPPVPTPFIPSYRRRK